MRAIVQTSQFKADLKKIAKSGKYDKDDFLAVINKLVNETPLSAKHRDHDLGGKWKHHRECHEEDPDKLEIQSMELVEIIAPAEEKQNAPA